MNKFKFLCITFLFIVILPGCITNPTPTDTNKITIKETENEIISLEDIVHLNNCGGKIDVKHTVEKSYESSVERSNAISGGVGDIIRGEISAKYGDRLNSVRKIDLGAPPNTNMVFLLSWSMNVIRGSIYIGDESVTYYTVSIPINVELKNTKDLGCPEETEIHSTIETTLVHTPSPIITASIPSSSQTPVIEIASVKITRPKIEDFFTYPSIFDTINYSNPQKPSTVIYETVISPQEIYRWGAIWCAIDDATLKEILEPLTMKLIVNGEELNDDQILEFVHTYNNLRCKRWITLLSNWEPNSEVTLELNYEVAKKGFDGFSPVEPGKYRLIIEVKVR